MTVNEMPDDPFEGTAELDDDDELDDLDDIGVPLSEGLERELAAFVLIGDADLAVSRAETLDLMVDALRELEEDEAIEEWVSDYGDSDFHLAQGRDGQLVISDVFPVTGVIGFIPKAIVKLVSTELMEQDEDDRVSWLETLSELTTDWAALLSDEEKMVGHLIRAHEVGAGGVDGDQDDLIARHAELHAAE